MNTRVALSLGLPGSTARSRAALFLAALSTLLLLINLAALNMGAMPVGWRELLALAAQGLGYESALPQPVAAVLLQVRLPRMVLALLAGAGLAISGAALQALFRNPLADPGLLGISSGAALGAGLMMVLAPPAVTHGLSGLAVPLAAFLGALAATAAVLLLAGGPSHSRAATTLLAGIAVNALTGAGIGLMTYLADDAALRQFTFWTLGSLGGTAWPVLVPTALLTVPAAWLLLREAATLNVLMLGEREARHLGIDVVRLKRRVIGASALSVGALVAVTGMIGFVGLVAPHLVRLAIGPDHRALLPGAALAGALLLGTADLAARTLTPPAELPIGLLTALLGGPFFLWLLRRKSSNAGD